MSEIKVKFEPNVALPEIFQSLGTLAIETPRVTNVFTKVTPIYTGQIKLKSAQPRSDDDDVDDDDDDDDDYYDINDPFVYDIDDPFVIAYEMLSCGRKLVLERDDDLISLYENSDTFITGTCIPARFPWHCVSLVLTSNTEALVSDDYCSVFKVKIDDKLTVSEIKANHKIYSMTKYGEDIMCVAGDDSDQWQLCVIDKNMKKLIKTILKDDGTLFSISTYLGVSDDKNIVYVLDAKKGCYGITLDSQGVFHYQNLEVANYRGLVVDSDGLFIGCRCGNKYQVEKLNFSGERQEVCSIFGDSWPLKLVENELVLFQLDKRNIALYCLLK